MIKKFNQFNLIEESKEFKNIMDDIKKEFNEDYIKMYIVNNYHNYIDDEDVEESDYDDPVEYYIQEGAGGNGIENDLINLIWEYVKDKYNIDLSDNKYEDLRYDIEYYMQEIFPHYYFVDYRKDTDFNKLSKNWDDWDI